MPRDRVTLETILREALRCPEATPGIVACARTASPCARSPCRPLVIAARLAHVGHSKLDEAVVETRTALAGLGFRRPEAAAAIDAARQAHARDNPPRGAAPKPRQALPRTRCIAWPMATMRSLAVSALVIPRHLASTSARDLRREVRPICVTSVLSFCECSRSTSGGPPDLRPLGPELLRALAIYVGRSARHARSASPRS
jgi:hypothetical protein